VTENLDRVREVYAEWALGNMRAGAELFDPDVDFEAFLPDSAERVAARGPKEVEGFMREFLSHWRDYRLFGDEFRAVDSDTVLVLGHQCASGRRSGAAVDHPMSSAWKFRDGRVVHLVFDPDPQKIFEAAGVAAGSG
jgi:ketosteroid isomerase-like protein